MAIILLVIAIILLVMGIKSMKYSKKKGIALIILAVFAVGSIGALGSNNEPKEPELTSTEQVQEGFGCSKGKAVQIEMILNECGLYDFVRIDEFQVGEYSTSYHVMTQITKNIMGVDASGNMATVWINNETGDVEQIYWMDETLYDYGFVSKLSDYLKN